MCVNLRRRARSTEDDMQVTVRVGMHQGQITPGLDSYVRGSSFLLRAEGGLGWLKHNHFIFLLLSSFLPFFLFLSFLLFAALRKVLTWQFTYSLVVTM